MRMWKYRRSDTDFRARGVPAIPQICCSGSINESGKNWEIPLPTEISGECIQSCYLRRVGGDFHRFSEKVAIHRFRQKSDTGLELDLLQEYTFICLDIFRSIIQNKDRKEWSRLDKWLIFLCEDDPEMILELCRDNPDFRRIYKEFYQICRNGERMMEMFSEELEIMDRNTVKLMIDELEEELADIRKKAEADLAAEKRETEIEKKRADAAEKENERLRKELERLRELNK